MQIIENKQQRPMLIATKFEVFCGVANAKAPAPQLTHHHSQIMQFLIGSAAIKIRCNHMKTKGRLQS
jgi:hypothetical protein